METTLETNNIFFVLPSELLVDILLLTNKQAIVNFATVNSTYFQLFNRDNGLWQQITCKIFHWGNSEIKKVQEEYGSIDWKKEFRITSFYTDKIRNNYLISDERQAHAKCLTKIDDHHFKFYKELDDYDMDVIYFSVQSPTRLYPHPVGNFTVAYYEVEFLAGSGDNAMLNVGAALEGYVDSLPGIGRNSYGYCNDGRVGLECELAPEDAPKIESGDFMGFGINFESSSIFFTKNGQVIREVTKAYSNAPILHIKALHATVGLVYDPEFKVNFGTKPFKFDILKYQQQHCNAAQLQPYSYRMRSHVAADSMSDALEHFIKLDVKTTLADYNIPKSTSISPFLYMITYMRSPDDWQGEPINPGIFQAMRVCQAIINSASMLPSLENSPISVAVVRAIAARMDFPYENLPWNELVRKTIDQAYEWWFQQLITLTSLCAEHLTDSTFEHFWASGALALHLFAHDMPTDHYAIQAAASCLHFMVNEQTSGTKIFNFEEVAELGVAGYQTIFSMRPMASLYASVDPAREQLARQEKEAKRVYGPDEMLDILFDNPARRFQVPKQALPLGYKRKFKPLLLTSWEAFDGVPGLVINGIYGQNIPVDKHDTLEEFLKEFREIELKKISTELIVEYAESCLEDVDNFTDEELMNQIGPICVLFNFQPGPWKHTVKSRLKSFLQRLIQRNKNPGKLSWLKNAINSRWAIGAGVALIASVAVYWTRKKLTQ